MTIQNGMRNSAILLTLMLILGLAGCGTGNEEGAGEIDSVGSETTTFQLDLSSILDVSNIATGQTAQPTAVAASGQLMIVPFNGTPFPIFPFNVTLEEGNLTLTTDLQVQLDPGLFTFYMLLNLTFNNNTNSYAGIAPVFIVKGGNNTVTMTLNPLLVSIGINGVADLLNMTSLIVNYPDDIADYTDPRFGISVDGGDEIIFKINNHSNTSNQVTIFLPYREAAYQINIRFYDGAVVIEGGVDDLIEPPPPNNPPTEIPVEPIKAEVTYSLSTGGDVANFYVPIPGEVMNEVGGPSTATDSLSTRLKTILSVVGPDNSVIEEIVSLNPWENISDEQGFVDGGTVTIPGFIPGPITWALTFYKIDTGSGTSQHIGYCASSNDLADLDPAKMTMLCDLVLFDSDIVTSHPPATLTVTVTDTTNNTPLSGAVVTVNGETVGITGIDGSSTFGILDIFLLGGTYTFQATVNGLESSAILDVSLTPGQTDVVVDLYIIGPDLTPPAPVNGPVATEGDATVILNWQDLVDADRIGLRVLRSESADPVSPDAADLPVWNLAADATSITDNTAINGITYYYTIFTIDAAGNFSAGVQVSASPQEPPDVTPPGSVSGLVAVSGDGTVTLTWQNPGDVNDFAGVRILRSTNADAVLPDDANLPVWNLGDQATFLVDSSVTNDTTYYYHVFAVDTVGNFSAGVQVSSTPVPTPDTTPPSTVSDLAAAGGDATVILTWQNPSDSDFAGLRILRSTSADPVSPDAPDLPVWEQGENTNSLTDNDVVNGTTYYYSVFSRDTAGNISAAVQVSATPEEPPDVTPPGPVSDLAATPGDATVILTWVNPVDDDRTGLWVFQSTTSNAVSPNATDLLPWKLAADATSLTDAPVVNGTTYYYSVFTHDAAGNFSSAATISALPEAVVVPNPEVPESIVLTASRQFRPRVYIDGEADLSFVGEGETVTVSIPTLEDVSIVDGQGSPDHYLLILYLGDVKCMYLGGKRDRHLRGMKLDDIEDVFEKAFKSPACFGPGFGHRKRNPGYYRGHTHRDGQFFSHQSDGEVTTEGPIRARVITGDPHFDATTIEVIIPVIGVNKP